MRWQSKAAILRLLSRTPGGKQCYLAGQRLLGTTRPQPKRDFTRAIELIEMIRESGQSVRDAVVYEIGTGWHPYTPLAFYLAGARLIETVDVNPWLSRRSARTAVVAARPHLNWFANSLELNLEEIQNRYERVHQQAGTLNDLLSSMNCRYTCPGDATCSGLKADTVDFVVSSNVLEHVPEPILKGMATESQRILKPGGLAVHRFNPGDHYANDDSRVTTGHFLQFSEEQWQKYGDGLAYHNRLRCPQYSRIFRDADFLLLIEKTRVDPVVLDQIQGKTLPIHEKFKKFPPEDLAADYMWLVGMKSSAQNQNQLQSQGERLTPSMTPQTKIH